MSHTSVENIYRNIRFCRYINTKIACGCWSMGLRGPVTRFFVASDQIIVWQKNARGKLPTSHLAFSRENATFKIVGPKQMPEAEASPHTASRTLMRRVLGGW